MQKRAPAFIGIAILFLMLLYAVFSNWSSSKDSEPSFQKRKLATNNENIHKIWEYDNLSLSDLNLTNDIKGNIYSIEYTNQRQLISFNPLSGKIDWVEETPFDTVSSHLLINNGPLFSASALRVSAYSPKNGQMLWSTFVGTGHVSYTLQLDHSSLREYYGDQIFEIDPDTGKIINSSPMGGILWITGNYQVQQNSNGTEIIGIDRTTRATIWQKSMKLFTRTPPPLVYKDIYLIVKDSLDNDNYCALDLKQGEYVWCLEGNPLSNFAVDDTQGIGYVLDENYKLIKVDLASGKILDNVSFLPGEQKGNTSDSPRRYSNYLGVAEDHTIILYFGDSKQLFGLSW